MKIQINDIRTKTRDKITKDDTLDLSRVANEVDLEEVKEKVISPSENEKTKELTNPNRRKFLRVAAASGGVLIAGSLLNKVSRIKNLSLDGQTASSLGSMFKHKVPDSVKEQGLEEDLESFFQNFSIVKNENEYILYNKYGDNILTIDRDA